MTFECCKRPLLALGNASHCRQIAQKIPYWQSKTELRHYCCHLSCILMQGKHQDHALVQVQICRLHCSKKKQRLCRDKQDNTMALKVWLDTDQHAAELPLLPSAAVAQHVLDQSTGSSVACLSESHVVCRTQRRKLSWLCHGFESCTSTAKLFKYMLLVLQHRSAY